MREDLPDWLGEPEPDAPGQARPRRRLQALLVMAGLPWLLVVGLLLRGTGGTGAAGHDHSHPAIPGPSPAATTTPAPLPSVPPPGRPTPDSAERSDLPVPPGEVAAVVLASARNYLTGIGPRLMFDGVEAAAPTYLEHLLVESLEPVGSDLVVATVLAVVLTPEGDVYREAALERLVVPIRLTQAGAIPAGTPWRLPTPTLAAPEPPVTVPIEDDQLVAEAAVAIRRSGIEGEVASVGITAEGPWVVTLTLPGGRTQQVWLLDRPEGLHIAGADPSATTADPPDEEVDS